ncbi:MAG TPA: ester cyclase [Cytophagales bacterium]|jgi:predicted ester cyclase|nr:ester cyclase [Cytophagales bacterium]
MSSIEQNKEIVKRFNKEVIEQCNENSFKELMHPDFVNRTAPAGSNGADGMWNTFKNILHPAFPDLKVEIYDQLAEGDKVTTRKAIIGTHLGNIFGIAATNKPVRIDVIDIVRIEDGKYIEHWGVNTLERVIAELKK